MGTRHFTRGVVRGRILKLKQRKTKLNERPYLDIKLSCPSSLYGDVEFRVRMFGEKTIKELIKHHKDNSTGMVYLDGNTVILESRGRKFLSIQAMKFKPWTESSEDVPRASFIIEGICENTVDTFTLRHIREGQYPVNEGIDFKLPEDLGGVEFGDRVTLYGHFADTRAKWGGSGEFAPIIEAIDIREKGKDVF